ncbi:MAG: hypothetical protein P8Q57_12900 [Yoonia sp.]|nr:hypothetical protein [Yoonia sp.]
MAKQPAKGRKSSPKSKPKTDSKVSEAEVVETVVDAPIVDAPVEEPIVTEPVVEEEAPQVEEPAAVTTPEPAAAPAKSGSAMPLIFGGLVAGAIGFGAAYLVLPQADTTLPAKISAQESEIAGLRDQIAAIPAPDFTAIETAIADAYAALAERITGLETRLDDLSSRAGNGGSIATAAYEAELDALKSEIENLRGTAVAELEEARAQAASIEENAEAAARAAAGRAALARVQGGLETGAPLGEALDDLAAVLQGDVPAGLAAVRDGTPTLASLQAEFPDLARNALNTARSEGVSGEAEGGFASFLRNQFDVRSVVPQEGDTTDAILSRAESNLRNGRLTETLSEIVALPEVARAELSDWVAMAETRADALAAAATLSSSLNEN